MQNIHNAATVRVKGNGGLPVLGVKVPQPRCGCSWYHQKPPGHEIKRCILCPDCLWSKKRARGHTEAPVGGTQRVRTFLCVQGTISLFSGVFSLQGGVLVKGCSACQGWSLLLLFHLIWMASPVLRKASSFERSHKHKEYLLFPSASPAAGYKVGKNKDFPCLVIMGLKPTHLTPVDLVRDP